MVPSTADGARRRTRQCRSWSCPDFRSNFAPRRRENFRNSTSSSAQRNRAVTRKKFRSQPCTKRVPEPSQKMNFHNVLRICRHMKWVPVPSATGRTLRGLQREIQLIEPSESILKFPRHIHMTANKMHVDVSSQNSSQNSSVLGRSLTFICSACNPLQGGIR